MHSKVAIIGQLKRYDCSTCHSLSDIIHKEVFNSCCANYPTTGTINFYGLLWNVTRLTSFPFKYGIIAFRWKTYSNVAKC